MRLGAPFFASVAAGLALFAWFFALRSLGPLESPGSSVDLIFNNTGSAANSTQKPSVSNRVRLARGTDQRGNLEIDGLDESSFNHVLAGLGWAHAHDRISQMLLLRAVSRGRLSQFVGGGNAETARIDRALLHHGFARNAERVLEKFPLAKRMCEAYAVGVNVRLFGEAQSDSGALGPVAATVKVRAEGVSSGGNVAFGPADLPLDLKVLGYDPRVRNEPWIATDTLALARLTMWSGLAETQQTGEYFVMNALASGEAGERLLRAIFPGQFDGMDAKTVEALRQVNLSRAFFPEDARVPSIVPAFAASNNWVVAPKRALSGGAILATDPHLNILQTPAVWYETSLRNWLPLEGCSVLNRNPSVTGISFPGLPSILMGRTRFVSWGQTYGFMDHIDYFVEEIDGSKYRVDDEWHDLQVIEEPLSSGERLIVLETQEGHTIELDPTLPDVLAPFTGLARGFYLSRATTHTEHSGAQTQEAFSQIVTCARTVEDVLNQAKWMEHSTNTVAADMEGNIGYQQTGALPHRAAGASGLYPVTGFNSSNLWIGRVDAAQLSRTLNPESGVIVTANGWHAGPADSHTVINMHLGQDRADRIEELLDEAGDEISLSTCMMAQTDVLSIQARRFMAEIRPLMKKAIEGAQNLQTDGGGEGVVEVQHRADLLSAWDLRYTLDSRGAVLFDKFYLRVMELAVRRWLVPSASGKFLLDDLMGAQRIFYHYWDALLLDSNSILWDSRSFSRDGVFKLALIEVLADTSSVALTLREQRAAYMNNMLFAGKLGLVGRSLGIDVGPVSLTGSRATPNQGFVGKKGDSWVGVGPSWRFVTDMTTDVVHSSLPGGASGNFLSSWYTNRLGEYCSGKFAASKLA